MEEIIPKRGNREGIESIKRKELIVRRGGVIVSCFIGETTVVELQMMDEGG